MEVDSLIAGTSSARLRSSRSPPMPFNPATGIEANGSPASATILASMPRSVPTSNTSLSVPRFSHSRATAMAGNTWPPVPPPAIASLTSIRVLADVQQDARGQQHHHQAGPAVADERQRDALGGQHADHHGQIE